MAKRFTGRCGRCRKFVKKVDHHPSGNCGVCRGVVAPTDPRMDAERMRGAFFPRRGNPLVLAPGAISFAALAGMNPPMTEQQAMAWLEKVGSWPSSDPEVQRRTAEAERVLRVARHRGNPVYPVRTATTPPFPHPPAGYVDAPDIFAADRMARSQFGSSAKFGVGYDNLARAKAREESGCGCRHGTSPEGYPWFEPCAQHRVAANKHRPPSRSNPHLVHRVKTAKSRRAKCGATDGNATLHASQVTCPGCCGKKRRNPKGVTRKEFLREVMRRAGTSNPTPIASLAMFFGVTRQAMTKLANQCRDDGFLAVAKGDCWLTRAGADAVQLEG